MTPSARTPLLVAVKVEWTVRETQTTAAWSARRLRCRQAGSPRGARGRSAGVRDAAVPGRAVTRCHQRRPVSRRQHQRSTCWSMPVAWKRRTRSRPSLRPARVPCRTGRSLQPEAAARHVAVVRPSAQARQAPCAPRLGGRYLAHLRAQGTPAKKVREPARQQTRRRMVPTTTLQRPSQRHRPPSPPAARVQRGAGGTRAATLPRSQRHRAPGHPPSGHLATRPAAERRAARRATTRRGCTRRHTRRLAARPDALVARGRATR